MNNDFCTKHNLSFCEREFKWSQKHFHHHKRQSRPVLRELLQGRVLASAWPSPGLRFPVCGMGEGGEEDGWLNFTCVGNGLWAAVKSSILGPSAEVQTQRFWLSCKELSRGGWGRGLRVIQAAGEKPGRPPPTARLPLRTCPVVAGPAHWSGSSPTPGCLCPLVA